jgi:alkylhydroperoxidase/carboxymuconolactone decarboxylase family protein YurZ
MAARLPARAQQVAREFDAVWKAHQAFGSACSSAGPLEGETRRLVKIALAVGRGAEGAVHAHVRQALAEGVAPEAIRHVALLAMPTIGFPQSVAALSWIDDILDATYKPARQRRNGGARGA